LTATGGSPERGCLLENLDLKGLERRSRLETKLGGKRRTNALIDLECVRLAATAI
jgi:hypothetical protein